MDRLLTRRLSPLDAFFLYIDTPTSPLNIGGVQEFDGPISRDLLVTRLHDRIAEIPRYRQRVVPAPLGLGHPFWEDDPSFDSGRHVFEITLPPPGGPAELRAAAAVVFEGMLPRDRPLWTLHVVQGLAEGRSALVSKIHHAMVDGVSGVELLDVLFDLTPGGKGIPRATRYRSGGTSSSAERLAEVAWDAAADAIETASGGVRALWRMATDPAGTLAAAARPLGALVAAATTPVARLPFNRALSGGRRLAWLTWSFAELRQMRTQTGATLNDLVLAVIGDGLGRYAADLGVEVSGRTLRAMVPVNVRRADEVGQLGNRVSIVPVEVPFKGTPVERVSAVRARTSALKRAGLADVVDTLLAAGGLVPAPVSSAVLGLAARPDVLQWTAPGRSAPSLTANIVCTNVPGPQVPIYAQGRRLTAHYPIVPLAFEFGLSFAVFSYDQRVSVGAIADTAAVADLDPVMAHLSQAYVDLRTATGVPELPPLDVVRRDTTASFGADATHDVSSDEAPTGDHRRPSRDRSERTPRRGRATGGRKRSRS